MPPIETTPTLSGSSASTPVNVKLLLIGNASVGKSSLLLRFSDEAWIPEDEATATIGVDFRVSETQAPRCRVGGLRNMSCLELPGSPMHDALGRTIRRGTDDVR